MIEGKKVIAFMPALNEDKFIGTVLEKMPKLVDKVIVVDDGSTDNTAEVAKKHNALVIKHEKNSGSGSCYKDGFKKSLELGADIVVLIHSDGQHDPAEIPYLIDPILKGEAEYIMGARIKDMNEKMPFVRLVGNKSLSLLWSIATGYKLRDALTGYHAVTADALRKLNIGKFSNGYICETEVLTDMCLNKVKIKEVPVKCIYGEEISLVRPLKHGRQFGVGALQCLYYRMLNKVGVNKKPRG
ncbi:MAG: glycosyltransferase family 2 protein [Candidatus Nanoarchaeia archaeon]|nr:glycosyltransferase family 2 protein [Candidatus Nanoarchaeia archaeon]